MQALGGWQPGRAPAVLDAVKLQDSRGVGAQTLKPKPKASMGLGFRV